MKVIFSNYREEILDLQPQRLLAVHCLNPEGERINGLREEVECAIDEILCECDSARRLHTALSGDFHPLRPFSSLLYPPDKLVQGLKRNFLDENYERS